MFDKWILHLASRTAHNIESLDISQPTIVLLGEASVDGVTKAWTSTRIGLVPSKPAKIEVPDIFFCLSDKNKAEGFLISFSPSLNISKTPISFVGPNLFFILLKILYWRLLSPSKYKTVSTICSKTRGPAIEPSLVTCPIKIRIEFVFFAAIINSFVLALTWDTVPGELSNWGKYIVWIESITNICLFPIELMVAAISDAFVTEANWILLSFKPSLSALIFIWDKLSSPEMYIHSSLSFDKLPTSCNNNVDLPIPGSPPIKVTDPGTNPPPITLSTSIKFDVILEWSYASFFKYSKRIVCPFDLDKIPDGFMFFSSSKVFHSLHCSHLPIHLR